MVAKTIYVPSEILKKIDIEVDKLGFGISQSAWIVQACKEKLKGDKNNIATVITKLRRWADSFPKKPIKEIIEELENGKI